jgi:hypothetical protein
MTRFKTLTRVFDILLESFLSPAKNAKILKYDSDESLTQTNTSINLFFIYIFVSRTLKHFKLNFFQTSFERYLYWTKPILILI